MSLINQMLQDLDKRRASGIERSALPNQVRVMPPVRKSGAGRTLIVIGGAVLLASLYAWQVNNHPVPTPTASNDAAVSRPVPASAQPQPQPQVQAQAQQQTQPQSPAPASRLALDLKTPSLALSESATPSVARTDQKSPPARGQAAKSVTAPLAAGAAIKKAVKPAVVARKAEPAKAPATSAARSLPAPPAQAEGSSSTAVKAVAKPPQAAVSVPETKAALANDQIDKRAQQLTPQQLAENEYRVAANFLNEGRLPEAQEGFQRALQHFPGHIGARQGLFGLLLDAKKASDAERVLQDGLKLNPGQPGFAMATARLQVDRGDVASAVETLQKTAPYALNSPDYIAFLAALYQRMSRHVEAVENYRTALRLSPGSGVWWMGLGISMQALNRGSEAQDAFRHAKAANTLNPELQAFVDQRLRQLQ